MENKTIFDIPEKIVISQDIKNPDQYLDKLITDFAGEPQQIERFETVRLLPHEQKVAWLLGLRTVEKKDGMHGGMQPETGCIIVIITVMVTYVIGKIVVDGVTRLLTEQREEQKEVQKCPGSGSGSGSGSGLHSNPSQ